MRKITHYLLIHPSKAGLIKNMGYTIENEQEVYDAIKILRGGSCVGKVRRLRANSKH